MPSYSIDGRRARKRSTASDTPLSWWLLTLLAFVMVLYSVGYLVLGEYMYPDALADSFRARPWGIYSHAFFALFALAVGPFQFLRSWRQRRLMLHRTLGKVYVVAGLLTGASGLYLAAYAFGGWIGQLGFAGMAVATVVTLTMGYVRIRQRDLAAHRKWMLRSYAVLFSAVTFRLWLALLVVLSSGALTAAYQWASWLSWVLNLVGVEWYVRRTGRRSAERQTLAAMQNA